MKVVTQEFLDAQKANSIKYYFTINMYRRYWDSATSAYLYEVTPIDLKPYIIDKSTISWQLDTEGLNVWRVSNVSLELKNNFGEFNEGSGKFFDDTYQRFKTKIEIKIGYILADETTETVYNFVGLLVDDPSCNFESNSIVFSLSGKEVLCSLASADNVSNEVTGETLGTGALISEFYTPKKNVLSVSKVYKNGVEQTLTTHYSVSNLYQKYYGALITFVTPPALGDIITCDYIYGNNQISNTEQIGTGANNAEFYTDYKGVRKIDAVYIDGDELGSIDYEVTNLNDKDDYAKVTFPVGVGIGQVVTCDYHHWYKDIAVETLLGYLLDEAGFPLADRTIETIDISELLKYEIWNTKAEWDAMGNLTRNIDTTSKIGSALDKNEDFAEDINTNDNISVSGTYPSQSAYVDRFDDLDSGYTADALPDASSPAWSKNVIGTPTYEINPAGILHLQASAGEIISYLLSSTGKYFVQTRIKLSISGAHANTHADIGGWISFRYYNGNWQLTVNQEVTWINIGITDLAWADYHIFKERYDVTRNETRFYMDDVFIASKTGSGTYDNFLFMDVTSETVTGTTIDAWIDYSYWDSDSTGSGSLISDSLNLGITSPDYSNFGTLFKIWTDPADGSTLTIYTQTSGTSNFSSDNDSWREVTFAGNVGTISGDTVSKRYIRWKAEFVSTSMVNTLALTLLFIPAQLLSETIDCGVNLDVYNAFTTLKQDNDGQIKIYSQSSSDGTNWDSEVEIVSGVISSTKKRYIRFKTIIYVTASDDSPELMKEYFTYKLTSLNVAMADFTGMSIQDVMEIFAGLFDYEIGVDTEGKYFFRQKNSSVSIDMELSSDVNIISADNDTSGWERIYNKIKASIGIFEAEMSPVTLGTAVPHSITKYGTREYTIENPGVKIDDNLDLASALVETYYNRYYLPKRNMRLKCKMLPQLELSDTVNINYKGASWEWYWGDTMAYWGKENIFWYSKEMLPAIDLLANVVGLELDINDWFLYITIREI